MRSTAVKAFQTNLATPLLMPSEWWKKDHRHETAQPSRLSQPRNEMSTALETTSLGGLGGASERRWPKSFMPNPMCPCGVGM